MYVNRKKRSQGSKKITRATNVTKKGKHARKRGKGRTPGRRKGRGIRRRNQSVRWGCRRVRKYRQNRSLSKHDIITQGGQEGLSKGLMFKEGASPQKGPNRGKIIKTAVKPYDRDNWESPFRVEKKGG